MRTLIAVLLGFAAVAVEAMFLQPQIEEVPIERLLANVQKKIAAEPKNPQWHYTLARVQSMAYATGAEKAPMLKDDGKAGLPHYYPYSEEWRRGGGEKLGKGASAQQHLPEAIKAYREATRLDPKHIGATMGLAWCLDQAGEREEAVKAYRQAFQLAWTEEKSADHMYAGASVTVEAGEALLRLLPASAPLAEREEIQQRITAVKRKPMVVTPVLVPVGKDTELPALVSNWARVRFDMLGDGQPGRWPWLTPKAAWLVWDPTGNGQVKTGRQLFGNRTWWIAWRHGYEPLAALDDNGDGQLTGDELRGLSLWHDANVDGITQPGEVRPVVTWDVVAIACAPVHRRTDCWVHPTGITFRHGGQRPTYDWLPRPAPSE